MKLTFVSSRSFTAGWDPLISLLHPAAPLAAIAAMDGSPVNTNRGPQIYAALQALSFPNTAMVSVPDSYESGISIIDPAGNLIGFKVLNARHRLYKFLTVLPPGGFPSQFTLYNNSLTGGNTVLNMSAVTVSARSDSGGGFELPLEDQSGLQLDGALQTTPGVITRSRSLRWGESVTTSEVVRLNSTAGALFSIGRDVSFEMRNFDNSQLITLLGPGYFITATGAVVSQWTIEVDDIQFQDIINAAGHIYLIQSLANAGDRVLIGAMEAVPSPSISGVTADVYQPGASPSTDYLCMDLRALSSGTILSNAGIWNSSAVILDRFLVPYNAAYGSGVLKTYAYQNKPDWDYIPL